MHLSEEPLMEEYSIAMQVWSLSKVDLAEMAANSVRMSSFEGFLKRRWLGHHWDKKFELEYKGHTYTVPDYKNHCKDLIFSIYFFSIRKNKCLTYKISL